MKLFALAGLLAAAVVFAGAGRPERAGSADATSERTITVTGQGAVKAVPNQAQFSFGVTTQADTATAALAANSAAMRKVIAALKDAGVAAADLQTQQVSLEPRTNDNGDKIVGYTASNSVSVTTSDLAHVGTIVDAAVEAGATDVSGPSLTRSDSDELYQDALKAAVANARAHAEAIASASGEHVGIVDSVVEGSSAPQPRQFDKAAAPSAGSTPVEPGTTEVDATVTVVFQLG